MSTRVVEVCIYVSGSPAVRRLLPLACCHSTDAGLRHPEQQQVVLRGCHLLRQQEPFGAFAHVKPTTASTQLTTPGHLQRAPCSTGYSLSCIMSCCSEHFWRRVKTAIQIHLWQSSARSFCGLARGIGRSSSPWAWRASQNIMCHKYLNQILSRRNLRYAAHAMQPPRLLTSPKWHPQPCLAARRPGSQGVAPHLGPALYPAYQGRRRGWWLLCACAALQRARNVRCAASYSRAGRHSV
jgi:hypothetical protein